MQILGDLVVRSRRSDDPALGVSGSGGYDYHRFCTTAWKTGNFFRHLGVREGVTVGIRATPAAQPILGFFGAVLLGASVRFDPPNDIDARVLLAPTERVGEYELPPGGQYVAYGDAPADPTVSHFETDVWSENPVFPETPLSSETPALTGEREVSHAELLDAGTAVADEWGFGPSDSVAVRTPLSDPRTIAAGLVAPLLVGGECVLDTERTADFAVVDDDSGASNAPESSAITLDDVPL
ncbi:long-chain fatty acid--CoA ligase [Haladaptatus sp. AB618]|uniref:long-chain fatty acid--CoA ligase n=1 Tax=Haladaptatus sp. AB618 TaxID=2934173 RepID=UPI00209BCE4D|nr:long-chain fatty acid--CoA ligase [Haladaptatus sp. AB618]MCO8254213.1 long-chain fatty acid--CoA ligase [Haladaptatus sp. AB618]